jgi:expansin (peptidoglycan-binding protein)
MRRLALVMVPLGMVLACSSADDPLAGALDDATIDGGSAGGDAGGAGGAGGATTDAKVQPTDARADAPASDAATGTVFMGQATYYDADGTGACGFKATPNDLDVAALNGSQYKKSWCGQCALVTGPKGMVKVRIVDLCPGCAFGGLDLSRQAFEAIASLSAGRVKITWHVVPC